MKTYNQIVATLQTIADDHLQLQSFQSGPLDKVDIGKLDQRSYPFLYCELLDAEIDHGTLTYGVELFVADMILPDLSDRNEVYSDTLQMLHDVIEKFIQSQSTDGAGSDFKITLPINATSFTVRFDNELTGWSARIDIEVSNTNNLCIAPFS